MQIDKANSHYLISVWAAHENLCFYVISLQSIQANLWFNNSHTNDNAQLAKICVVKDRDRLG